MNTELFSPERIQEMRQTFDDAFARPHSELHDQSEDILAIRIAGDPYAIKIREIIGLVNRKKVIPFPSPVPELLGFAGIRGDIVPVYSLAALLGYSPEADPSGWLILCKAEAALLALTFHHFEGHFRLSLPKIQTADVERSGRKYVSNIAHVQGEAHTLINLPSLVDFVQELSAGDHTPQEG
ncbi:chemotaxis protein CheW [Oligoflexus tunisiensis]|uniref:chemotaxis protein CheW n=1 Tax=Oligoflexus tunisiensis TaxID=708132 RepID=UPI00114CC588|nr:chemotaxis protein CheW [Oligoflexus tunisiensis]